MSANVNSVILHPIHLGSGADGEKRQKNLNALALQLGFQWGEKPSVGRLVCALADAYEVALLENQGNKPLAAEAALLAMGAKVTL